MDFFFNLQLIPTMCVMTYCCENSQVDSFKLLGRHTYYCIDRIEIELAGSKESIYPAVTSYHILTVNRLRSVCDKVHLRKTYVPFVQRIPENWL